MIILLYIITKKKRLKEMIMIIVCLHKANIKRYIVMSSDALRTRTRTITTDHERRNK